MDLSFPCLALPFLDYTKILAIYTFLFIPLLDIPKVSLEAGLVSMEMYLR